MGWGLTVTGLDAVFDLFDELESRWSGDTLYIVAPTVNYAIWQEKGKSGIEARPFMKPAGARVMASPQQYAAQIAASQRIDITTEEGLVRALALAVQNESKRIADRKDIRDTGTLIASITIEQVQ